MGCEVVPISASVAFLCRGRSTPQRCFECSKLQRRRDAVALCDGPAPPASKKQTCDSSMCGEHRTRVGPDRDLCPSCARRAAASNDDLTICANAQTVELEQPSLFGDV